MISEDTHLHVIGNMPETLVLSNDEFGSRNLYPRRISLITGLSGSSIS
jgi:hypothetical protein